MQSILHIIDTTGPGGAETVFVTLADKSRDHGYDSIALIRGKGWVYDELQRREVQTVILEAKGRFNWRFLVSLISLIRKERICLIQSHLLGANVYSALAGWITGVPVIATFHGMVDISPDERFKRLKLWLMERGIRRFIAVSNNLADAIEAQKLLSKRKTSIIYNGISTKKYQLPKTNALRQQLGITDDSFVIGCLGNIRAAKSYDNLIRAIANLENDFPGIHVIVAGHKKESLMRDLEKLMEDIGVSSRFHFIGFQQDSAQFLSQIDMFVLSSISEGFSISTIEAMAAGVPVLATRCGGPEEIIEHESNGILVEVNNDRALSVGIAQLISNEELRKNLVAAAHKTVNEKFTQKSMLDKYVSLYREAID